jgi:Xaa-Pro dipeptidase
MNEDTFFRHLGKDIPLVIINGTKGFADPNFFYFSGIPFGVFEHSSMVVKRDGTTVISNKLDKDAAELSACRVLTFDSRQHMLEIISAEVGNAKEYAINASKLSVEWLYMLRSALPGKEVIDASEAIARTRQIKTEKEREWIKKACSITMSAFVSSLQYLKEGMTEAEFSSRLIYELLSHGSGFLYSEPTVAFGENTAYLHYSAGSRKLRKGDAVLMDFGATYRRYVADVTRTVFYGRAPAELRDAYDLVDQVRIASLRMIKDGVEGREVDALARKMLGAHRFGGSFVHGLGHGIGLEIHDHPALSPSSDLVLREHMAITVEPGLYAQGMGGVRIEDNVLVTSGGAINLTDAAHELIEIS